MEERLDAWLKTYRAEKTISPVDWEVIPEACRIRLDNYARDEAVRRADAFAHDGILDLRRQEAVRQLVDSMAQSWRMPGEDIRSIVEEFYDELPPRPGQEFEKLAIRLFRRTLHAPAAELFNRFDPQEEHPVIAASARHLDVPPNQVLDRNGFLRAFQNAYDTWTTKQPREAVLELLKTAAVKEDMVQLNGLLPYLEQRGARIWAQAVKLEQDIGVDIASRDELIRILKRYALMVRRGGLEAIGLSQTPETSDAEQKSEAATVVRESEVDIEPMRPVEKQKPGAKTVATEPRKSFRFVAEETASATEEPVVEKNPAPAIAITGKKTAAASRIPDPARSTPEPESRIAAPPVEAVKKSEADTSFETEFEAEVQLAESQLKREQEEVSRVTVRVDEQERESMLKDPDKFHVRNLDELDDDDLEAIEYLFGEDVIEYEDDSGDEESAEEDGEGPIKAAGTVNGMQMRKQETIKPSRDVSQSVVAEPARPHLDRFAPLRSGTLRQKVVQQVFGASDKLFDGFLAKLARAGDWQAGKRVIAEELLDRQVNLEEDPARELFFALKRCMTEDTGV